LDPPRPVPGTLLRQGRIAASVVFQMGSSGTRIGTEIAGFRIESVLGRGGMSVVYVAEQTRLGRKVALKILASGLIERDESFRDRFLRESHVAAGLDHPNIIPIFDAGEEDGCLYIAMRYVEGRDLGQILEQEGPLGIGRTIFILDQVASALDAAHEHGLVHRDVKPANVLLVGNSDRVYLTDFGVAKPTTSAGLTRTGFFIGTPDYSAPEQIEGREVDARTDVYALGALLYSCLTALAPYARLTEVAVLQAHLLEPPPKLRQQRPDLPRGLDRVIATAMAKSKDDRYPTCSDLLAAAEAAARDRPTTVPAVDGTFIASPELDAYEAIDPSETTLAPASFAPAPNAGAVVQASATQLVVSTDVAPPTAATPPQQPPPEAPTAQDPAGRAPSGPKWMLVALIAAVAVAAALAVVLVTRGGGGSPTTTTKGTSFRVALSSSAEVPTSISSTSSGTVDVTIDGTKVCWDFTLSGVDNPTAAHIHQGGSSVSGPVVVPLGAAYKSTGCTTTTAATAKAILANPSAYYVNVHTATYPDGAVRGQLGGANVGPTGATEHAVGLPGIVPNGIFKGCTLQAQPVAGAVQTAVCAPSAATGKGFYPDRLELSTFADTAALLRAYSAERKSAGASTDFGRCDGSDWAGEGTWVHAPAAAGLPAKPGGRRFCYFDGNFAVMVWAHEKFGQATHVDFLGIAREGGSDHAALFNWWRFWTHRIGKCQQEGCTASVK
jgi:serine/threonine protein kinase